ncbi:MAG: sigma-70 family RNA polymerase sigma factor [Pirellula sp.]|jgi:RNA polymerase sigma-70 factor (ECF subfamily)|nr:sigma-70 family RNA polymerase sigma factor [Pirellula sp.]
MTHFPETNEMLIARVKDLGDADSWLEFVGIYQPTILKMARRRGLQDADARDVAQQILISVSHSISSWSPNLDGPPFRAWLVTITRNAITNALSRKPIDSAWGGSSVVSQMNSLPEPSSLEETRAELSRETRNQTILWAANQIRNEFSHSVWQAFWMTAIEGKPISEVAKALNCSAGSIYVSRYRVIARLKEKVHDLTQGWEQ